MKKTCGNCKWFMPFYKKFDNDYKPVDVGECTNPDYVTVDVVTVDFESSKWEKKEK